MSGYSGRYISTPNQANSERISRAGKGPRSNMKLLLEKVCAYIADTALYEFEGDTDTVPCPDANAWAVLASTAKLPPEAQMRIIASPKMAKLALQRDNSIRDAYFEVAQAMLRIRRARSATA